MSCNINQIPSPPTALSSCAVPVGGSNSSILDMCCNSHVNAVATYGPPGSNSNTRTEDGCFQFCVTDEPDVVQGCLTNTLREYAKGDPILKCFNVATAKKDTGATEGGYGSAGTRVRASGVGWVMGTVLSLAFVGAAVGTV
ncbi:hypothetical protein CC86DRAFT_391998 [Ophiobolus disseminans]|uniref:Uncharacterized protein n=1 Tax=Ophiobolus disseminans TaxID=1469910 RepID=A0A6A7A9J4_9PLEO|nr:hypothetical protein CC86DRAFT_391998 [Ophiobolus disseminans]